jgi:hypothetical protein
MMRASACGRWPVSWSRGTARITRWYILIGPDTGPDWPLQRAPFLLETTTPGVFAVGDVRHGSMKRVAAAVGEGSTVIRLIHDYLALAPSDQSPDPLPGRPAR